MSLSALSEHEAWLHCFLTPGLGVTRFLRLLLAFGSPHAALAATLAQLAPLLTRSVAESLLCGDTAAERAKVAVWLAADPRHTLLTLSDADYPPSLLHTPTPPPLLFLKGERALLARPMLAMVGSRAATQQGERHAEAFAEALSQTGLTVVSGLAAGIDGAAHRGALRGAGATIAVIGTGIDRIYPAGHAALARQIAAEGLIISEFPLGMRPLAANFPRRIRLIAGLAQGCLVVEANIESGSLITGRLAAEYGREVFALPGSVHSPQARGCHRLIREGATLVETVEDILSALPRYVLPLPVVTAEATPLAVGEGASSEAIAPLDASTDSAEEAALFAVLGFDPLDVDSLCQQLGLTAHALSAMLLRLELVGKVESLPGGRYQRLIPSP